MYMVNFPEISVAVGTVQVLNAVYGLLRSCGSLYRVNHEQDYSFLLTTYFQWICTVGLQILVQVSYLPAGTAAAAAPSQTMLTLGIHIILAVLDIKMRTTPEIVPDNYYGYHLQDHEENEDEELHESWKGNHRLREVSA